MSLHLRQHIGHVLHNHHHKWSLSTRNVRNCTCQTWKDFHHKLVKTGTAHGLLQLCWTIDGVMQALHGWRQSCAALAEHTAGWQQPLATSAFHSPHSAHLSAALATQSYAAVAAAAAVPDLCHHLKLLCVCPPYLACAYACLHVCVYDTWTLKTLLHLPHD